MALNASPSTRVEIAILAVLDPLMMFGEGAGDAVAPRADYDAGCTYFARCFATCAVGRPTTLG